MCDFLDTFDFFVVLLFLFRRWVTEFAELCFQVQQNIFYLAAGGLDFFVERDTLFRQIDGRGSGFVAGDKGGWVNFVTPSKPESEAIR